MGAMPTSQSRVGMAATLTTRELTEPPSVRTSTCPQRSPGPQLRAILLQPGCCRLGFKTSKCSALDLLLGCADATGDDAAFDGFVRLHSQFLKDVADPFTHEVLEDRIVEGEMVGKPNSEAKNPMNASPEMATQFMAGSAKLETHCQRPKPDADRPKKKRCKPLWLTAL